VLSILYADENALVLEDLTATNYELANRKERFDLARSKLVIEKLAKFHAMTAKMHERNPESIVHMMSPYDEETPLTFFLGASFQESMETIGGSSDLKQFVSKLENFDILQEEKEVYSRVESDRFRVLNHGDLWISNIFFKYDDQKNPVDALLVS
jgi:thiamine kinase-like enzyme